MSIVGICFAICVVTFALYLWNPYKSLGVTALISIMLFYVTGCVDSTVITNSFGHTTAILTCCMFVVSAGFNKTQFVKKLAQFVNKAAKGSLTKVMVGYIAMAVIMCQLISSNLIPFCILYPLLKATVEDMDVSPSKVMFPLGLACIVPLGTLPVGGGATTYATMNAVLQANGSDAVMGIFNPMIGRLPLLIFIFIYCAFFAIKTTPDKPAAEIKDVDTSAANRAYGAVALPSFQEYSSIIIFFGVTLGLIFSNIIGLQNWQVAMIGAILMIITGVLNKNEATRALPIWVYLVFVGGQIMASALNMTGAGSVVGDFFASIAGNGRNNLLFYSICFLGPYIITQFILNQTAINMFYPIVIQACMSLGISPIGAVVCVQAAGLSAFVTPMATGTVPYMMGAGGYDIKQLLKISIIPTIMCAVVSIVWMSIIYPVF